MAGNSFGHLFKLTSFGESHGASIGGVIDGCPAGLKLDLKEIQHELNRRRPGQSNLSTPRNEADQVEFLSGIMDSVTLGTPIGFIVKNTDHQSKDYEALKTVYRPSHADYVYDAKYGIRDHKGGGRSSARETIARVVAGSIAKQLLKHYHISIHAFVKQIGPIKTEQDHHSLDLSKTETSIVRCPDETVAQQMIDYIEELKKEGDTCGGIIQCMIKNVPAGIGEPVFDKLNAELGKAMLSINAVKGFEFGSGFDSVHKKGSELNDEFVTISNEKGEQIISTKTNYSGGIQGGISNGMPIYFNVAFKPVASIKKDQNTIDKDGTNIQLKIDGRHDPCVVPRAVVIVESMAAIVLADLLLRNTTSKL